jgi:periplasmic protein CpxP/Spy
MKKVFLTTVVSAALAGAAPIALSQSATGAVEAPGTILAQAAPAETGATGAPRRERQFRLPSERVEARLAHLRNALNIAPSQEPQWEQFANVLRTQAREMDQRIQERRAQASQTPREARRLTAIERLERRQKMMEAGATRLNQVIAAAKPLYETLTPEQQQVADQMIGNRGKGRHFQRGGIQRG